MLVPEPGVNRISFKYVELESLDSEELRLRKHTANISAGVILRIGAPRFPRDKWIARTYCPGDVIVYPRWSSILTVFNEDLVGIIEAKDIIYVVRDLKTIPIETIEFDAQLLD